MIRAILFDYGGVFTYEQRSIALFRSVERAYGLPEGGVRRRLHSGEAWVEVSTGRIRESDYWERVHADWPGPWPSVLDAYAEGPFAAEGLNPRMVALARQLRCTHRVTLLSNATISLRPLLERRGLIDLFDDIVISAEVGLRKPDPQIFVLACRRLELAGCECLLVDNKVRNTDAARCLGLSTVLYESYDRLVAELERRCILEVEACTPE